MKQKGRWRAVGIVLLSILIVYVGSYLYARMSSGRVGKIGVAQSKIAVIKIEGVLTESFDIVEDIKRFKERADVKAVVLRIDSPGGAVVPAQEIYEEVKKLRAEKKVIASLGNMAASGGYYIACAAHEIVCNPGTLTGSIGVISEYMNIEKLMDKIGWRSSVVKSGQFKDLGNPMREMTREEKKLLQDLVDDIHQQFVQAVAEGRNMDIVAVQALSDGRVFTGQQAKVHGLVDRLGNFEDAVQRASELAGIKGKPLVIYPEDKKHRLWRRLLGDMAEWISRLMREEHSYHSQGFMRM